METITATFFLLSAFSQPSLIHFAFGFSGKYGALSAAAALPLVVPTHRQLQCRRSEPLPPLESVIKTGERKRDGIRSASMGYVSTSTNR